MKTCPVCQKQLASAKYVYIHILTTSKSDNPHAEFIKSQNELILKNSHDIKSLANNQDFYLHIDYAKKYLQKLGIGAFKCEVCGDAFPTYKGIQAHIRQKNSPNYFDQKHNDVYNQRKDRVIDLIKQGKMITEIVKEMNIPSNTIRELAKTSTAISCKFCNNNFINSNSLLNHVRIEHPEYLESIKEIVIQEYDSDLSVVKVIKKHGLLLGNGGVIKIWRDNVPNCDVAKRANKVAALTEKKAYASGERKIWCEGLTTATSPILNKAAFKISQARLSGNRFRGIDEDDMDPVEVMYFNRIKKRFRKNLHNCLKCNVHYSNRRLDVHHIIPFRISRCNFISNLSLLCMVCHSVLHGRAQRLETQEMSLEERSDLYLNEYNKYILEPIEKDSGIDNPEFYDKLEQQKLRQKQWDRDYYNKHKNDPSYKQKMRARTIKHRLDNPDKQKEYQRKYRERMLKENPELWKQKRRQYRQNRKSKG